MKTSFQIFSLAVLLTLLLTACANAAPPIVTTNTEQPTVISNSKPQSSGGVDACSLLSKADAESILGTSVKDAEHPIEGAEAFIVTSCVYHVQNDTSNDKVSLIVSVSANGSTDSAQVAFNEDKNSVKDLYGATPVDVPNLGDAAMWTGGSGNYISMLKGDTYLTLRATNYQSETPAQPMLDLAHLILSRLP